MNNTVIAGGLLVLALTLVVGLAGDEWRDRVFARRKADATRRWLAGPAPRISIRRCPLVRPKRTKRASYATQADIWAPEARLIRLNRIFR